MTIVLAYAARLEGAGLDPGMPVFGQGVGPFTRLHIGAGKAAAAFHLGLALARARPRAVISIGVCGVYPVRHGGLPGLDIGDPCLVTSDRLVDDGVETEAGFIDMQQLGFGHCGPFDADPVLADAVEAAVGPVARVPGATVSTCSGNEARSAAIVTRTGAAIETMEGAAIAMVCRHFGVPSLSLRTISNETGDRSRGRWDLDRALHRLHEAVARLTDRLAFR